MVYLCNRIKPLKSLWCHISRINYNNPTLSPLISNLSFFNPQFRVFIQKPTFFLPSNSRFFAAPVQFQVKPKQEEKDSGPRLNENIKADIVRLVTEEGHDIVSRMEALQRAAALKLDLVEVDRNSKPPVCKIMAYHMERYKKKVKDKDRAKSKSEVTLRKGDCKEVRLSAKIQENDLQMKANAVKRLIESGYRVKCMATGVVSQKDKTGKNESEEVQIKRIAKEQNDLSKLIARLSAMIEDVSVVESGPFLEKTQAYIVVRHIKFGLPKKSGSSKNASKKETNLDTQSSMDIDSSSTIKQDEIADQPSPESADETPLEENRYKRGGLSVSTDNRYQRPDITPVIENRYKSPESASGVENKYKRPESPPIIENRYKRLENAPVVENRYNRPNNSMPIENRYNRENNDPVMENRYNRENNAPVTENRYNRENNAPVMETRYNRANNAPVTDNKYSRENYAPPNDNRYNRVNNSSPGDNRYNRETNSQPTDNRYRRDNEYNAYAKSGRIDGRGIREQTQLQEENRYRNENNLDQTRHRRPQEGPPTPPYSGSR